MQITVEISYYPLLNSYIEPVTEFLKEIAENEKITVEPGTMSTVLTGQYEDVMDLLEKKLKLFMEKYPSVFTLKVSNSCKTCK
jgi:uncharacterized protein YqgV (UPF0045/DUF77 family)